MYKDIVHTCTDKIGERDSASKKHRIQKYYFQEETETSNCPLKQGVVLGYDPPDEDWPTLLANYTLDSSMLVRRILVKYWNSSDWLELHDNRHPHDNFR